MAKTISDFTGDGVTTPQITFNAQVPDSSGSPVLVSGRVDPIGAATPSVLITDGVNTSPASLAMPALPAGGTTRYFIVQVDTTAGTAAIKYNDGSPPTPDAGSLAIVSGSLQSTDTDPVLDATVQTPDS